MIGLITLMLKMVRMTVIVITMIIFIFPTIIMAKKSDCTICFKMPKTRIVTVRTVIRMILVVVSIMTVTKLMILIFKITVKVKKSWLIYSIFKKTRVSYRCSVIIKNVCIYRLLASYEVRREHQQGPDIFSSVMTMRCICYLL